MMAMKLIDVVDNKTSYGILMCANSNVTEHEIQDKVYELKGRYINDDWIVEDIIENLPKEWCVYLQKENGSILI